MSPESDPTPNHIDDATSLDVIGLPRSNKPDPVRFRKAVDELLQASGFVIDDTHLSDTAERVYKLWSQRLLDGYDVAIDQVLGEGFADKGRDMVLVRDIAVHGMCPHHLVPWRGVAHVAYLPDGRLHGFGRIARLLDALSHRLSYQEWFSRDVVQAMLQFGKARGAACLVETEQLCLLLGEDRRGDERVVTSAFSGVFEQDANLRAEFYQALHSA